MEVRDAVEADAEALAAIVDVPAPVMRDLVHDRTVRVAERRTDAGPNTDTESVDAELLGFVSFDAHDGTIHVTRIAGSPDACERLLSEPIRFAVSEGMDVELVTPQDESGVRQAAEAVGFREHGPGPRFDGRRTVRYRLTPD